MKILVIGGSRFLGKAFVDEALKQGHEVTVFNRGNNNAALKNVEILIGDRNGNLDALKERRWDAVLDTCGLVPRSVRCITSLLKEQTDFYAFVSSISVYKDWVPDGIEENYPLQTMPIDEADELTLNPAGPFYEHYGKFKSLCELEAEQNMPGRVLNIRAGQLVGENDYTDRLPYWVSRIASGGKVLVPGDSEKSVVQLIDVKDLAIWILRMMEEKICGTYNVTGNSVLLQEVFTTIKEMTGSDAEFVWANEKFLMENKVAPWTEMPLWIPEKTPLGNNDEKPWSGAFRISIEKALLTGLVFRPLQETIAEVHMWMQENQISDDSLNAGISHDRERELLKALAMKK